MAVALAAAVSSASAQRLEVSEQHFLVLFRELTFENGGTITVVCPVNIEGSFHSAVIRKVSGQLIGYITEAIAHHPCRTNEGWALNGIERIQGITSPNTLPWHILYLNFRGILPRITEIEVKLVGAAFRVEILGALCLYQSTQTNYMEGQIKLTEGRVTALKANEEKRVPLFESQSGALCPAEGVLKGEGSVGTQTGWREITVRLVL